MCTFLLFYYHIELRLNNILFCVNSECEYWVLNDLIEGDSVRYVKGTTYDGKCTRTYDCHRSGFYKSSGTGLRRLKSSGSYKINGVCPSQVVCKTI